MIETSPDLLLWKAQRSGHLLDSIAQQQINRSVPRYATNDMHQDPLDQTLRSRPQILSLRARHELRRAKQAEELSMGTQPSTSMSFNRPLNLHSIRRSSSALRKPEHRQENSAKVHHQVLGLQILSLALLAHWPRTQQCHHGAKWTRPFAWSPATTRRMARAQA